MNSVWDNSPSTYDHLKQLQMILENKDVDVKHYIGNFGFDLTDTYAYYITSDCKLMRVRTTWEPILI